MKGSVDLVASFALLFMASLTIVFGAMWNLSDQRSLYHPKSEGEGGGGGQESAGAVEGLEITEMSAAYFVVFASIVLLVIFFCFFSSYLSPFTPGCVNNRRNLFSADVSRRRRALGWWRRRRRSLGRRRRRPTRRFE